MIAMALAADPALLIADEPTTALDATVQAQILALLAALQARRGLAMLFVSHDLAVVEGLAQQVAVIDTGRTLICLGIQLPLVIRKPLHDLFNNTVVMCHERVEVGT
jgi:ABC-type glutathione transport system ATPase component